jgi:D-alanine-D-alanine ligase
MAGLRIGVVRGGPSSEYEVSLKTGGNVLKFLPSKYKGVDILITRNGEWHLNGVPMLPQRIFRSVDVLFNAMHGEFGEDGKVQQIFERHNIFYTGSGVLASCLAMNKAMSRKLFFNAGIKIPKAFIVEKEKPLEKAVLGVFRIFSPPWIIKPSSRGSSVGVKIINNFYDLMPGIAEAFEYGNKVLVEEYIFGREATCGILENFRKERYYALPPVEIIPSQKSKFFDYNAKYNGSTREICPAMFDIDTKRKIEYLAKKAHKILGCKAYSRSDFIISRRGIFLLETNTLPGLTAESLFPKSAEAVGLTLPDLLDHLIKISLNKRY